MGKKKTDRQTETIAYLNSYLEAKRDLARLEEQLSEIRGNHRHMRSYEQKGAQPNRRGAKPASAGRDKLDRLEELVESEYADKLERLEAIRKDIESLPDANEKNVLTYRYIRGYPWEKIAQMMGYEISWVFRIHRRALKEISNRKPY